MNYKVHITVYLKLFRITAILSHKLPQMRYKCSLFGKIAENVKFVSYFWQFMKISEIAFNTKYHNKHRECMCYVFSLSELVFYLVGLAQQHKPFGVDIHLLIV